MHNLVDDFFCRLVYIDLIALIILGGFHSLTWIDVGKAKGVNNEAIGSAAQAGISGLGILLASSFVVVQLTRSSDNPTPANVESDIFFASAWFIIALALGFLVVWRLSMYPKDHGTAVTDVGIMFGLQLIASLLGAVRLVLSLAGLIY